MKQIKLVNLMLQETGTYNRQFSRPYEAKTTNESLDILGRRIGEVTHANPLAKINGNLISGLCGDLVVPATAWDHELSLPNGFGEKRMRFCLEVHVEQHFGTDIYFYQGYTEYLGISLQGTIDPEMVFYINSYIRVNRAQDFSGLSSDGFRDVIAESAQVIDGRFHTTQTSMVYGLRPEDLFTGIQSSYMAQMHQVMDGNNVIDDRINKAHDVMQSGRKNSIPSNFLSKVVESYRHATSLADFGSGNEDIYSRATQNCYEGGVYQNPFIRALSTMSGVTDTTTFTMNELARLDPTINTRTHFQQLLQTVRLHQVGDTNDNWGAATLETQLATIVTHAVSGLMLDNMLISVGFNITNMTLNGMLETRLFPGGQAVTTADMRQFYTNFVHRLETEVMPDVTRNNTIPVNLTVYADLYGETTVQLSLDGRPPECFVTPSFCDALMAPIITTNSNDFHGLTTGIEEIVQCCGGVGSMAGLDIQQSIAFV